MVDGRQAADILAVGPVPPPYHGSGIAMQRLLDGPRDGLRIEHVDTSRLRLDSSGRFAFHKLATDVAALRAVRTKIRSGDPGLLYFHLSQLPAGAVRDTVLTWMARRAGTRIVAHLHGAGFRAMYRGLDPLRRDLVRRSLQRLNAAIVLDESLRDQFDGLVPPSRIHVVPNGVPEDLVPESGLRRARAERLRRTELRVLFLSNLAESKGYPELIRACGILRTHDVPFRAVFAGGWEDPGAAAEANTLVDRLGIADACRFPGVVTGNAKLALLLEADVFVLPTRYPMEGQPLAIIEAMAAELPVISTPRGAIPAMVGDEESGFLIAERDVDALAARLELVAANRDRAAAMGAAGRRTFLSRFTVSHYLARLRHVLSLTLSSHGE